MEEHSIAELTAEKVVNFLDTKNKEYDWRYETSDRMKFGSGNEKVIHWIATLELSDVSEDEVKYPLYFFCSAQGKLVADGEISRDVDAASTGGTSVYLFDLRELMKEILRVISEGHSFYHFFVEEAVYEGGLHTVDVLYRKREESEIMYGIGSKVPWYEMPVKNFLYLTNKVIDEEIERIPILYNKPYNWLK